jgi:pimeloyl-ACP methyl ester carboxylesterase
MKETVFLLPGLLCDATVWQAQLDALGDEYDCRVPDFRGCDSLADMADRVLADAPGRFAVAGHSMGARVALEVMDRAGERVQRLALMDTGVHGVGESEPEGRASMVRIAEEEGMAALARAWATPMVHESHHANEALMAEIFAMVERYTLDEYRGQINALLNRRDAEPLLAAIRCPTLVLVGAQDAWSPPEQHEPIVEALADAQFVVIPDCGHMAPMEQPEAVTRAMRAWLGG